MEMSEAFATTTGALAPLVWAIGTLEVQEVAKRVREWSIESVLEYERAVVVMAEAEDEDGLNHAQAQWQVAQFAWLRRSFPPFILLALWATLSTLMMACTVVSLRWLSEDGGPGNDSGPAPDDARFIYWAIVIALAFITLLPMYLVWADLGRSRRRLKHARGAVARLENQARERMQTARGGRAEGPPPA